MKYSLFFLIHFIINSSDVFVRTVDMNDFSKSIRVSQNLIGESQLIKTLQEELCYNGNPIQLACHSKAFGDLEMLAQSDADKLFLPINKQSLYDLYKLAHYMQISQNRMRAIQRELCYSMDEFRALPDDIKGMLQNDIVKDPDIQYHLVKSGIPHSLSCLHLDTAFTVFDKKYIGRIVDIFHEESEAERVQVPKKILENKQIGIWPFRRTMEESKIVPEISEQVKTVKVLDNRHLELFSLDILFGHFDNTQFITPQLIECAKVCSITLDDSAVKPENILLKSFGSLLFVNNSNGEGTLRIFDNLQNGVKVPITNGLEKIACNKKIQNMAWYLIYAKGYLQIIKLHFDHGLNPQFEEKITLDRHVGENASYDLIFDKYLNVYRVAYFSPRVDDGNSMTLISWKDDFEAGIQQKIIFGLTAPIKKIGLSTNNNAYFVGATDQFVEYRTLDGKHHQIVWHKNDCSSTGKKHSFSFCASNNGLIYYFYYYSYSHYCANSISPLNNDKCFYKFKGFHSDLNAQIMMNNDYLYCLAQEGIDSDKDDNPRKSLHHTICSLKPIMAIYKELLPRFKKSASVPEFQNNNNVAVVIQ